MGYDSTQNNPNRIPDFRNVSSYRICFFSPVSDLANDEERTVFTFKKEAMKCKIKCVKHYYSDLEEIKSLEGIGFLFGDINQFKERPILKSKIEIELNSIEELFKLTKTIKKPIIIQGKTLEIYNGYIE